MEPYSSTPEQSFLEELRRHRAELRESMGALEDALAAPATTDLARWAERVHVALVELSGDFRQHVDITEGPGGLYRDLLETSPRLSDAVAGLTQEHVVICRQVDDLLARLMTPDLTGRADTIRERWLWCRSAGPDPCTAGPSPISSACAPSSCRPTPASSRRSGFW